MSDMQNYYVFLRQAVPHVVVVFVLFSFFFVLNIAFPCNTQKKHMEVMEHAISEALINDLSVATKHFAVHIWEVLSPVLIQLARLISH